MKTRKTPARVTLNGAWVRRSAGKALTHFFSPMAALTNVRGGLAKNEVQPAVTSAPPKRKAAAKVGEAP